MLGVGSNFRGGAKGGLGGARRGGEANVLSSKGVTVPKASYSLHTAIKLTQVRQHYVHRLLLLLPSHSSLLLLDDSVE